jgi:hypothetical protein
MPKTQHELTLKQIELTLNAFDERITLLARHYRGMVIAPLEKKYNLKFWSGMGNVFFEDLTTNENINDDSVLFVLSGPYEDDDDEVQPNYEMYEELNEVFSVLNIEIHDSIFAYWF